MQNAEPTDDQIEVRLLRTRSDTLRWYARSRLGVALFLLVAVLIAAVIVATLWTPIRTWASETSRNVAAGIVGTPTPAPTTDVKSVLKAQRQLAEQIERATATAAAAERFPNLSDDRSALLDEIARARRVQDRATTAPALRSAAQQLERAVGDLPTHVQQEATAAQAAKEAAEQRAAEEERARQAEEQAAAERAQEAQRQQEQSKPKQNAPAPTAPAPQAPSPPAPAPAPAPATARTSVVARCSTAATVTFTATGGGTVTISAGGRSSSGSGSASVTVSSGPGNISASASASGSVQISFSAQGACS